MASYARTQRSPEKSQMSVLAQAKPAIISTTESNNRNSLYLHQNSNGVTYGNSPTGILSEKINSTLRFSVPTLQERDNNGKLNHDQKFKHIEDDNILQKQNASNQMRQAAVMAAVASQQKIRLSATERLALTAKRPMTNQQLHPKPLVSANGASTNSNSTSNISVAPPVPSTKPIPAPMPTLETLLAVQRQLQQHTKQNLTSVPQQVVNNNFNRYELNSAPAQANGRPKGKPLPPSPPKSPNPAQHKVVNYVTSVDTYDKDLPPLPNSVSTCTSSDDSQMNSLDSHQSSPATSLVSLPPPPPPISSYLQQYDEVNSCQHSIHSNSSTPSITSSSDMSSVKQFSPLQVKSHVVSNTSSNEPPLNFTLPAPYDDYKLLEQQQLASKMTTAAFMPPDQALYKPSPPPPPPPVKTAQMNEDSRGIATINQQGLPFQYHQDQKTNLPAPRRSQPYVQNCQQQVATSIPNVSTSQAQAQGAFVPHNPTFKYQEHLFNPATCDSVTFQPRPPVPINLGASGDVCVGFDEPDFRFPTPPPPDLLLAEEEEKAIGGYDNDDGNDDDDDDDFQCRIPTPPHHKSMSSASFQDLHCHQQQQRQQQQQQQQPQQQVQKQTPSPLFNSPTFCAATNAHANCGVLQPPPLFRQQPSNTNLSCGSRPAPSPSQLTVCINNEGGLLSTAPPANNSHPSVNVHHHHHHHHHQMLMASMATSSSSPSSSSDGDGQSSNSSSSTSGIHSSIDSPSSSNSKLDDFNYGGKLDIGSKKHGLHESSRRNVMTATVASTTTITTTTTTTNSNNNSVATTKCAVTGGVNSTLVSSNATIRPALKQKKSVSFSDKVEMVACAEEQSEDHLPNPLLARVLAGKIQ